MYSLTEIQWKCFINKLETVNHKEYHEWFGISTEWNTLIIFKSLKSCIAGGAKTWNTDKLDDRPNFSFEPAPNVLTYKMAIALRPQICDVTSPYVYVSWRSASTSRKTAPFRYRRWNSASSFSYCLYQIELECGPMPNVMVALPNIGGALCSTPQSLADAHY